MPNVRIVEKWHTRKLELKKNLVIEIWEQEKQFHNLGVVIVVYKDYANRGTVNNFSQICLQRC